MCSFSSVSIVMAHWTSLDCASTASLIHLKTVTKVMGASLASSSDWNLCPGYWFLQKQVHLKCHKFINLEQMVRVATCWNCVVSSFQTNPDHVPGCPRMSQDVPGCPRMSQDQDRPEFDTIQETSQAGAELACVSFRNRTCQSRGSSSTGKRPLGSARNIGSEPEHIHVTFHPLSH